MVQANDTTSEKRHVPDLHEIDDVIMKSLSILDQKEYEILKDEQQYNIDYTISKNGAYLGSYRVCSGQPGWIVQLTKEATLQQELFTIVYQLIRRNLDEEFGKSPWLAEDKYPYRMFFHKVLPTTVDHIFDILEEFRVRIVLRDSGLNPGPFHDLVLEKMRFNNNAVQFLFNVARHRGFGLVGRVDVTPINKDEAEVIVANYQLTTDLHFDDVEIYLAGVDLLKSLVDRLQFLYGKPVSTEVLKKESGKVIDENYSDGIGNPMINNLREPPKPPEPKDWGGGIDEWLIWYHAMKDAGYKVTFNVIAEKSGFSIGYIKQKHQSFRINRIEP